jgi:proteic killer suppression protein
MIKTYRHKGLRDLFETGTSRRVDAKFHERCILVLDVLNRATHTNQLNISGWNLHPLKQYKPVRWSIWISGAWRITFEFDQGDAYRVDLEQYH